MTTIAIVDTLGLCYDGTTLTKRGLGGSESAVILVSRELAKLGFDVKVFNDCYSDDARPGTYDGVEYIPVYDIDKHSGFDVFIGSRSVVSFVPDAYKGQFKWAANLPNIESVSMRSKYRVLWMHDTFCDGDDFIEDLILEGRIHTLFTLSDWHTTYIANCDHGKRRNFEVLKNHIFQTRNGMTRYIDWVDISKKDPNLFVYNSSVTKGLLPLVNTIWPQVKKTIPDAKLKVIGGYYRFRSDHGPDEQEKDWRQMAEDPTHASNDIDFLGVIPQKEIAEILAKSSYMIYPSAFPETFGISTLESMAYNTPLITCRFGALEETAFDIANYKIPYAIEPNGLFPNINHEEQCKKFSNAVVEIYHNKYLHQQKMYACNQMRGIEGWDTVALQWKQHFYKQLGKFLPVEEYKSVKAINSRVRKVFGRRFCNNEDQTIINREEKRIVVITPVYNAERYIDKCIESVMSQDYKNYEMIIIDDASTDRTLEVAHRTLTKHKFLGEVKVVKNETNQGAVHNQIKTIKDNCSPDDIVMLLDGDDWLVNDPNVFNKFNNYYHAGVEYTYGSCWSLADNIPLIAQPYPPEIKARKAYREYKFNWNMPYPHLRTFLAKLVLPLNDGLFQDEEGNWFRAGGDNATFYNIIEQADPDKVLCVPDIVYNYNDLNPINDYKVNGDEQNNTASKIISKTLRTGDKMFSVIVPTMWRCLDIFQRALKQYVEHELVGEIIVINNDHARTPDWEVLNSDKIRMFTPGQNIFVNPSWNIGVEMSKYDLLNIVNDDIIVDPKIFNKLQNRLTPDSGPHGCLSGEAKFRHPPNTDYSIDFIDWRPGDVIHHFGQCMFMHKATWTPIIDGLNIYFGDDFIFHTNLLEKRTPVLIYNIRQETPCAATTKDTSITGGFYGREQPIYTAWAAERPIDYSYLEEKEQTILEEKKGKSKILIAIPTAKYIESETFKSIYDLKIPEGYEVQFQTFYGYNIDQVRNLIADWVVRGFDYLLSVDSDIIMPNDTLEKMLAHDKDLVSGIYRQRLPTQTLEVYDTAMRNIPLEGLPKNQLIRIGGCGFGCVLVKQKVFADIGYPQFEYHSAINHNETFSEDLDFCRKATEKGFELYADTSIICGHKGTHIFELEYDLTNAVQKRLRFLSEQKLLPVKLIEKMQELSADFTPKVVYDIGACVLHFTNEAKRIWKDSQFIAFEAMDETRFLYEENNLPYHCGLLSDEIKQIGFYQNLENPGGNSYYRENIKFNPVAHDFFPEEKKVFKTSSRLDDVVREKRFPLPDLVKIDVQGSELDVLRGGMDVISNAKYLLVELQHEEYNKGAPNYREVIHYLEENNFTLVEQVTGELGKTVDGDYLFINAR